MDRPGSRGQDAVCPASDHPFPGCSFLHPQAWLPVGEYFSGHEGSDKVALKVRPV